MKFCYLIVGALSALLLGCNEENIKSVEEGTVCREFINGSQGKCSGDFRTVSSNYAVRHGRVYWATFREFYERPCLIGAGAFFSNMASPECLSSDRNEPYNVKERRLKGGERYTPAFVSLEDSEQTRVDWQQKQLAYYAKDEKAVYFKGQVMKGADPNKFSPIFPFGESEGWSRFNVSRSGKTTYLNEHAIGDVNFYKFKAFTPVQCPQHGFSQCTDPRSVDSFLSYGNWGGGVLGKIENEVVLVTDYKIYRFSSVVSPDAFMFASYKRLYFYSDGRFYEWSGAVRKFIDMDVAFFERNPR